MQENAKAPTKDSSSTAEQQFVRHVIELHDKYVQYVSTCFCNSSLFHKALKEAFEAFCNKTVAGSSSAELMASFCDNLLKKVRAARLFEHCKLPNRFMPCTQCFYAKVLRMIEHALPYEP